MRYGLGERGSWPVSRLLLLAAAIGTLSATITYFATLPEAGDNRGPEAIVGGALVHAAIAAGVLLIWRTSLNRSLIIGRSRGLAVGFAVASLLVWPLAVCYWTFGPRLVADEGFGWPDRSDPLR